MFLCAIFPQVRPKEKLRVLLQQAGADKDVFTMKEVRSDLTTYILLISNH